MYYDMAVQLDASLPHMLFTIQSPYMYHAWISNQHMNMFPVYSCTFCVHYFAYGSVRTYNA